MLLLEFKFTEPDFDAQGSGQERMLDKIARFVLFYP